MAEVSGPGIRAGMGYTDFRLSFFAIGSRMILRVAAPVLALWLVSAGILAGISVGDAAAAEMTAHRATYTMRLVSAEPKSGITGVSGVFLVEQVPGCRGTTLNQAVQLIISQEGGGSVRTRFAAKVWERDDAGELTFSTVNEVDGRVTESFTGRAILQGPVLGGRVDYTDPDAMTLALPANVRFPVALSQDVFAAAEQGTQFLDAFVFDGGGPEALNAITVFIGKSYAAGEDTPAIGTELLAGLRSWNTRFAYFSLGAQELEPLYEVGYRLFENGVIADVSLDYGDFRMSGTLAELDPIAPQPC